MCTYTRDIIRLYCTTVTQRRHIQSIPMCVCICLCVCVCVGMYVCVFPCVRVWACVFSHAYVCTYTRDTFVLYDSYSTRTHPAYPCVRVYVCVCVCVGMYVCVCVRACVCKYVCFLIHVCDMCVSCIRFLIRVSYTADKKRGHIQLIPVWVCDCVCVYLCVCVSMCVYIHVCVSMCAFSCAHACIYIRVRLERLTADEWAHIQLIPCVCVWLNVCDPVRACILIYVFSFVCNTQQIKNEHTFSVSLCVCIFVRDMIYNTHIWCYICVLYRRSKMRRHPACPAANYVTRRCHLLVRTRTHMSAYAHARTHTHR